MLGDHPVHRSQQLETQWRLEPFNKLDYLAKTGLSCRMLFQEAPCIVYRTRH